MSVSAQSNGSAPLKRRSALGPGLVAVAFSILVAALGVVLDALNVNAFDTVDKFVGDHRIAWLSPRAAAQRTDVAVVLITEETLLDYESRSPINRGLLAELIRTIDGAGPKAIGLDLIFDRKSSQDAALVAAIRTAKAPVVLGAIDERIPNLPPQSLAIQDELLKSMGRPVGHLLLERKEGLLARSDSTVRLIGAPYGSPPRDSFAAMLARAAGATHEPENRIISWQRSPAANTPLFTTIAVPQHAPRSNSPGAKNLFPDSWLELIKNRIVLVGATMVDRDQHTTPLSVIDGSLIPGVLIHAQALAQRLDANRDIQVPPWWMTFPVVALVAFLCFQALRRLRLNPRSFGYEVVGLLLIGALSFAAFGVFRIQLPSVALATAWAGGAFGGRHSDWLYRKLGTES